MKHKPDLHVDGPRFARLAGELLAAGHAIRFRARGKSMHPLVHHGDVLTVVAVMPSALRAGDIVFYRGATGHPLAHRVLAVGVPDRGYVLYVRGDASRGAAERVTEDRIIGRVVSLQRKGRTIAVASPLRRCLGLGWARYQNMRSTVRVYLGQWRRSVTVRS